MKKEFYDLAKKIADWHTRAFPDADKTEQLLKLDEEFYKLGETYFKDSGELEELADCFIVASSLWYRYNDFIGLFTMRAIVKHVVDADRELYDAIIAKIEKIKRGIEMTKDEEQGLQQAFTFENFKKLLYFVNGCVGEGWQIGKVDAGELLYFDILKDIEFDDKKFDAETDKFLGVEK